MAGFSVVTTSTLTSVPAIYKVVNAFAGAALGDILQSVEIYNQQVNPATLVDTVWNNLTQQTALGAITPLAANIVPIDAVSGTGDVVTSALYTAVVASAGQYAVSDVIELVSVFDPSTVPPTVVSTSYNNLTVGSYDITLAAQTDIVPGTSQAVDTSAAAVYTATTANAGQYAIGDVLQQVHIIDPAAGTVSATIYNNLTSGVNNVTLSNITDLVPGQTTTVDTSATAVYTAIVANAGQYAIGDVLQQVHIINPATNLVTGTVYNNLTTGANGVTLGVITDLVPGQVSTVNVVTTAIYTAVAANAGEYAVGDVLQKVEVLNPSTVPPTIVSTTYDNLTSGVADVTVANQSDIVPGQPVDSNVATTAIYTAVAANAGQYAIGDVLQQVTSVDSTTLAVVATEYNNLTSGLLNVTLANQADVIPGQPTTTDVVVTALYSAIVANVGQYAIGDVLQKVTTLNPTTLAVVATEYNNLTTNALNVTVSAQTDLAPIGQSPSDLVVYNQYTVVNAFGTANVGDIIQTVAVYSPDTIPATLVSTIYNNLTQQDLNIAAPPLVTDLTPSDNSDVSSSALYVAKVTVAGQFTVGDSLLVTNSFITSTIPATLISQTWQNLTTGASIATPDYLDIDPVNQESFVSASNLYTCILAYAGAALGDVLENVVTYDPTVTPLVEVGSIWNNLTQGTFGITAPTTLEVTPGTTQTTASDFAVATVYTATAVSAGNYAIGDILESIEVYNPAIVPPTLVSTIWKNLTAGTTLAAAPPITDITPGQTQTTVSDTTYAATFRVISAGSAGTSVGDILQRAVSINPVTSAVVSTVWNNLTAGTTIAAPAYANLVADSTASTPTYSTVTSLYYVVTAGTGYAVNDIVQEVKTFSTDAGLPTLITTDWYNLTQGAAIGGGVTIGDVLPVGTPGSNGAYNSFTIQYYAITAGVGYAVNDNLERVIVFNPASTSPVTVLSETWFNTTVQTELAAAPLTVDVVPGVSPGTPQTTLLDTTALYYATANNAGEYSIGDVVQEVVVLNPGTVPPTVVSTTFNNLTTAGQDVTVVGGDLLPVGTPTNYSSVSNYFIANTTNGPAGYTLGDSISQVMVLDQSVSPPAFLSQLWTNTTTGNIIAVPATISELTSAQSQLPPAIGPQANSKSLSVYVANQSTLSYFPVVTQYAVSTAFALPAPGAALGDVVQDIQIYDATVIPALLVSESWSNLTSGATYATAPAIGDLTPTFGNGLTNAELRAAPVVVSYTPTSRVSAMVTVGASTTAATTAGIVSASFYNNSTTVNATVAGGTLPPSTAISFQANDSDTLAAISYTTGVGGSLLIATLT